MTGRSRRLVGQAQETHLLQLRRQRSSALPSIAPASQRNINGKRNAGIDGIRSDAQHHGRIKLQRTGEQDGDNLSGSSTKLFRCHFSIYFPHLRHKCSVFKDWRRLREHMLVRSHSSRDQCQYCGKIFVNEDEWVEHTRAQQCRTIPREEFESFPYLTRDQDTRIRGLGVQGKSYDKSSEEIWRDVWEILFEGKRCTVWPFSKDVLNSEPRTESTIDIRTFFRDENLQDEISNIQGMENVPQSCRGDLALQSYSLIERWAQTQSAQAYVNVSGRRDSSAEKPLDNFVPQNPLCSSGVQVLQPLESNPWWCSTGMEDQLENPLYSGTDLFAGHGTYHHANLPSFPPQSIQGPANFFDDSQAWGGSHVAGPVHNFDSSLSYSDSFDSQFTHPTLPNDDTSQMPLMGAGLHPNPADAEEDEDTSRTLAIIGRRS